MSYLDINGLRILWTKIKSWVTNQGYGTYSKPQQGIPKTDLENSVQTSLSKADSALQTAPVTSVNSKTGAVSLTASDVGLGNVGNFKAVSTQSNQGLTVTEKENARTNIGAGTSSFSGNYTDLSNKPTIPTKVSQLTNDSGYTTNTGTITGITMNGDVKGTSGVVNLGVVLTEHQSLSAYRTSAQQDAIDDDKVDKVTGKGLSTNDYTTAEKNKLSNLSNYDDTDVKQRLSAIEGKEAGWDSKADAVHTHTKSQITDFPSLLTLGETSTTAYRGDRGKIAYDHSQIAHAPSDAEANQNAFSNVKVGSTTVAADSKTDTLELVAGTNVTLTPDATNDKVTITAKDTTYSAATTSAAGLMSATDKTKLDGIATGANKTTVDSALSSTSTNPVQNKAVNTAITNLKTLVGDTAVSTQITNAIDEITPASIGAATSSHTHSASNITAGTLGGSVVANATAVGTLTTKQLRNITISTSEPVNSQGVDGDIWITHGSAQSCPFPVGGIYISVVSTNPSSLWAGTNWEQFASGRTLVGINTSDSDFNTAGQTGGEKTHPLTPDEIPAHGHGMAHTHSYTGPNTGSWKVGTGKAHTWCTSAGGKTSGGASKTTTDNAGGGLAHNNLQPYITVYMWKRVS